MEKETVRKRVAITDDSEQFNDQFKGHRCHEKYTFLFSGILISGTTRSYFHVTKLITTKVWKRKWRLEAFITAYTRN